MLKMAGVKATATYSLSDPALGRILGALPTKSGQTVTDDTAMKLSAVFGCVRILSETIGSLPYHLYRETKSGTVEKLTDYDLSNVLTVSPNSSMTPVDLKESLIANLCLGGNAYHFIESRPDGSIVSLTPIVSNLVEPIQNQDGTMKFKVLQRGRYETYPQEKIWHVKGFGRDGLVGLSPLGLAREAVGAAMAQEEFGAKFFSQGGMPSGTVTIEKFLTQDQRDIARNNLQQLIGGVGNAHKWALLEGGMKPEAWKTMPLEDMQFLVSRKFSIQEIARFYRIPPHMLADLERATFSNIEHQSQEFVMFTLMPYFTRIEASIKKWLLPKADRSSVFLRFNFEGLLRADSAARGAFYSQGLQNGWITRNQVRQKESMNPSDEQGMDDYTVQVNLTPISKLGQTPAPAAPFGKANEDHAPKDPVAQPVVTVVLPDSTKAAPRSDGELAAFVDVAEDLHRSADSVLTTMKAVASMMKRTTDQTARQSENLIAALKSIVDRQQRDIEELKKLVVADRMAIFGEDGMPIGSRVVVPEKEPVH